jgi:hypothetical protein
MKNKTTWKPIRGFGDLYKAGTNGRIWSSYRGRLLSKYAPKGQYCVLVLVRGGIKFPKLAHRIIAQTFIPNPLKKKYVNHKNGKKDDNRVSNLEWSTKSEDVKHAFRTGLKVIHKGKRNPMYGRCGFLSNKSKPVAQINKISGKIIKVWGSARQAALGVGVSRSAITANCRGKQKSRKFRWKYVKKEAA